jgi:hypothetical protein
MSDTPRTDEHMLGGSYSFDVEFARELERELNAALAENTAMREAIREVFHSFADDPPSDASWLLDDRQNHALARLYPFTKP